MTDILKFDNSYSWARSKEVFYSVKLLPPDVQPHPQPLPLPVAHVELQERETLHWTSRPSHSPSPCPSPAHSSSEDEFFDCVQEQEPASPSLHGDAATVFPCLLETILPELESIASSHLQGDGACDVVPVESRRLCRPQQITGTSVSTQV